MARTRRKRCKIHEEWGEATPLPDDSSGVELFQCNLVVEGNSAPSLYRTKGIMYQVVEEHGSLFYGVHNEDGALVKLVAEKLKPGHKGSIKPGIAHIFISDFHVRLRLKITGGEDQLSGQDRKAVPPSEIAGKELEFPMSGTVISYDGTTCNVDVGGYQLDVLDANTRWGVDHDLPAGELVEAPAIVRLGDLIYEK